MQSARPARRIVRRSISAAALAIAVFAAQPAPTAQALDDDASQLLGTVHFAVSCNDDAQALFNRAMTAYYHAEPAQARDLFAQVLDADRECGMGHWGRALLALGDLYSGAPSIEDIVEGVAAIEQTIFAEPRTRRERRFLEAISVYYIDTAQFDHATRLLRMAEAFARMVREDPEDSEAAVLFGYVLTATALPGERSYWRQRRAAELFERVLEREPYHAGALHFMLRSLAPTVIAHRAADAARRYAELRPQSPLARAVLAHTGGASPGATVAAVTPAPRAASAAAGTSALRDLDVQVYELLQMARDHDALAIVEDRARYSALSDDPQEVAVALAVLPARYALERHAWSEAARLPLRDSPYAYPEAVTRFARTLGFARTGRAERARLEVAALARLIDVEGGNGNAEIGMLHLAARAWLSHSEGAALEAEELMRQAVHAEGGIVTHAPVLVPMRELQAELLLLLRDYDRALDAFESVLERTPERFRSVFGAGRAAELGGHQVKAAEHYRRLLELVPTAQGARFELGIAGNYFARLAAGG
jgi:tetratricopeptide (TPR) repeat protein